MLRIDTSLTPGSLSGAIDRLFELSAGKVYAIDRRWSPADGSPVVTVGGKYASRGWTEWTQGFQFGSAILQFAATGDRRSLAIGRGGTLAHMAGHLSHIGVHDHGFNNVSHLRQPLPPREVRRDEGRRGRGPASTSWP